MKVLIACEFSGIVRCKTLILYAACVIMVT